MFFSDRVRVLELYLFLLLEFYVFIWIEILCFSCIRVGVGWFVGLLVIFFVFYS